jgi:hypothetical protein
MKPLLLLDLDRTLFATDTFRGYVVDVLVKITGKQSAVIEQMMTEHSDAPDTHLRHTDFTAVLQKLEIPQNEAYLEITKAVPPNSLLLPDVPDFLDWIQGQTIYEPRILSFGQKDFQQLKLATCPTLGWLPADIILERKNTFIQRMFSQQSGALIDDKPRQSLHNNWIEITINRTMPSVRQPRRKTSNVWEITTLIQAKEILI